ncbi:MAG TPA: aminoglycoside phosphotransferase family protein [Gaiellaceae bacterium]
MPKMHDDELEIDEALVRRLIAEQFPQWVDLSFVRVGDGTVNVIYRLGEELSIRLPRRDGPTVEEDIELRWLPVLASHLPLDIPQPVARGRPGESYPWYWSIHTWIDGELPTGPLDPDHLASFVAALERIDPAGAPEPAGGRGKPLAWRDGAVRSALERVEAPGALELWEEAMRAPEWDRPGVWIHCDLDARNVLVRDGRLAAVLDWGGVGVGDPAVDVMVAWKLLARETRERFRQALGVDDATWLRARGWAVSQALIALGYYTLETNPILVREAERWLAEVLAS